jgi:hypothetical protein
MERLRIRTLKLADTNKNSQMNIIQSEFALMIRIDPNCLNMVIQECSCICRLGINFPCPAFPPSKARFLYDSLFLTTMMTPTSCAELLKQNFLHLEFMYNFSFLLHTTYLHLTYRYSLLLSSYFFFILMFFSVLLAHQIP